MKYNYRECDICSARKEGDSDWPEKNLVVREEGAKGQYVQIEFSYEVNNKTFVEQIDMCPVCFFNKIVEPLKLDLNLYQSEW